MRIGVSTPAVVDIGAQNWCILRNRTMRCWIGTGTVLRELNDFDLFGDMCLSQCIESS
jgi:hypothetical protein